MSLGYFLFLSLVLIGLGSAMKSLLYLFRVHNPGLDRFAAFVSLVGDGILLALFFLQTDFIVEVIYCILSR